MLEVMLARVSNRATWRDTIELTDGETGDPIDLTGASIVLEVADDCGRTVLSATTDNGKVVIVTDDSGNPVLGAAEFVFTRDEMTALCPGTYRLGGTVTIDDDTEQLFFGTVPVIDGVVGR